MNESINTHRLVDIEGVSKRFVKSLDFAGKIAQKLGANLVKLPQTPFLRTLVSEHGPVVKIFKRKILAQTTRNQRPGNACRTFRTKRDFVSTLVFEGIHLLCHDIGRIAQCTLEHFGKLENGGRDFLIAVTLRHSPGAIRYMAKIPAIIRQ